MQGYNLIAVFSPEGDTMLMCRRIKEPYKGLINFVGGKIEPGEENPLFWSRLDGDFFDMKQYAGEGNIGHIMEHIKLNRSRIFRTDTHAKGTTL